MTTTIRLAVECHGELQDNLVAAARRTRGVVLSEREGADGVITDSPKDALAIAGQQKWAAVCRPFSVDAELRESLVQTGRVFPVLEARWNPQVQEIRRSLDSGQLGDPGLLRIHCWGHDAFGLAAELDLALWMFGEKPNRVHSVTQLNGWLVHLGFRDGGMAVIHVNATNTDPFYTLSLIGSLGAAYADDHRNMQLLFQEASTNAVKTSASNAGAVVASVRDFFLQGSEAADELWQQTGAAVSLLDDVTQQSGGEQ